jgi:hypothetical protein
MRALIWYGAFASYDSAVTCGVSSADASSMDPRGRRLADPGQGRARRGQVPAGTRHGMRVQGTRLWLISSPVKHDLLHSSYLWRAQEYDRLGHTLAPYELEHCERWASETVLGVGEGEHGRRQGPGKKKKGGRPGTGTGSKSKSLFCGVFNLFSR